MFFSFYNNIFKSRKPKIKITKFSSIQEIMESDPSAIVIRIKTLDNSLNDMKVPKDITIADLKAKIEKVL